jgi:DNA polymerase I-like protein with 3'-5' exonuclease and polymerase domains
MSLDLPKATDMLVAFDTEASGLHVDEGARVSVVSVAWFEGDEVVSQVFPFDQGMLDKPGASGQCSLFDDAPNLGVEEWHELCQWLSCQRLTAHNIKYDLHIMQAGLRVWGAGIDLSRNVVWDTMVVNPIVFPNQSVGLKATAERLWGEQETEPQRRLDQWLRKNRHRYDLAPWDLLGPYAAKDAEQGIRLQRHQQAMIDEGYITEPFALIDREIDLAICLFRMESRGIGFDVEQCGHAAEVLRIERNRMATQLRDAGLSPITDHAARKWFYEVQGYEPPSLTEKGQPSVDKDAIEALAAQGAEGALELLLYNAYDTALSMWYEGWPAKIGADGRLRPSYWQTKQGTGQKGGGRGTVSGRLAVERVQLQAIPHDYRLPTNVPSIRRFFKPKPGHQLWEVDLSQAEIRVACHSTRCEPMRQVLVAGGDVHGETAQRVFGVQPDDPNFEKWRTLAKRSTFATLYGAGPRTFKADLKKVAGIDAPEAQCKEWLDEYRATFPEFQQAYRDLEWQAKNNGFIELVTGRRRWFSEFEQQFHPYKAFNQLIQGGVAEGMKVVKVEVEFHHPGVLLLEVHDSLVLEVAGTEEGQQRVKAVRELMVAEMEKLFGGWDVDHPVPWKADAKEWK